LKYASRSSFMSIYRLSQICWNYPLDSDGILWFPKHKQLVSQYRWIPHWRTDGLRSLP
jgi:hypothetical protein